MSILNVENVSHGFGARKILDKATFRLLKGSMLDWLVQMEKGNPLF